MGLPELGTMWPMGEGTCSPLQLYCVTVPYEVLKQGNNLGVPGIVNSFELLDREDFQRMSIELSDLNGGELEDTIAEEWAATIRAKLTSFPWVILVPDKSITKWLEAIDLMSFHIAPEGYFSRLRKSEGVACCGKGNLCQWEAPFEVSGYVPRASHFCIWCDQIVDAIMDSFPGEESFYSESGSGTD